MEAESNLSQSRMTLLGKKTRFPFKRTRDLDSPVLTPSPVGKKREDVEIETTYL